MMEIEGTRIGSVGPHSHTPETFVGDSTANGHVSSYGHTMDVNHGSSDLSAPIYSNESSEMSVTTESHDTSGPGHHSSTPHHMEGHYNDSGPQHHSGVSGAYNLSNASQNVSSLSSMTSHMPHTHHGASHLPSTSIMSHIPQAQSMSGASNVDSNFGAGLTTSTQVQPSHSGTTSLASSSALTTSVGGSMLSTGIGKKIKISIKKPDSVPQTTGASLMSSSIGMAGSSEVDIMNAHSYQMEAEDNQGGIDYYGNHVQGSSQQGHVMNQSHGYGYDSYGSGAMMGYEGQAIGSITTPQGGAAAMRKRSRMMPGEYDLTGSVEIGAPATKKRAKMTGGGNRGARGGGDAAYTPVGHSKRGGGTPGRGKRGGASAGGSGAMHSPMSATSRRHAPIGTASSRRDLEGTAMGVCYDSVMDLMERPEAPPFNQPVDPEALGIPNYLRVIKTPMDLRTVKDKVKRSFYRNAQEFVDDVRLIWSNAMTFNSADSPVYQMAEALNMYFEMRAPDIVSRANSMEPSLGMTMDPQTWAAVVASHTSPSPSNSSNISLNSSRGAGYLNNPLSSSTSGASFNTPSRSSSSRASSSTPSHPSPSIPSSGGTPASSRTARHDSKKVALEERMKSLQSQVRSAETQLANLKKNGFNQALNRAIDALAQKAPERSFDVSDVSALQHPLKASLAHILRSMIDIGHVREVVKILMQERFNFPRNGTELYLPMDDMPPITLRRIEHYIRTSYPDGEALLATEAPEPPEDGGDEDDEDLHANIAAAASAAAAAAAASMPRPVVSGPSAGTSASTTDESMLVDVLGFDAPSIPTMSAVPSTTSANRNHANRNNHSDGTGKGVSNHGNHHSKPSKSSAASVASGLSSSNSGVPNAKAHHAMLDESDSDSSDDDSGSDDAMPSNVMLRTSAKVLDIVPPALSAEVGEIKNAQGWSSFDAAATSTSTSTTPMRPTTPGSNSAMTPGGHGTIAGGGVDDQEDDHSLDGSSAPEGGSSWDAFRNLDAQNKQRDKERAELEEKQRKEREDRDLATRVEEDRKRKAAEEERNRAAEEEKAKREADIKARREAERAKREASSAEQGMDMMEQSSIMRDLEKELRSNNASANASAKVESEQKTEKSEAISEKKEQETNETAKTEDGTTNETDTKMDTKMDTNDSEATKMDTKDSEATPMPSSAPLTDAPTTASETPSTSAPTTSDASTHAAPSVEDSAVATTSSSSSEDAPLSSSSMDVDIPSSTPSSSAPPTDTTAAPILAAGAVNDEDSDSDSDDDA